MSETYTDLDNFKAGPIWQAVENQRTASGTDVQTECIINSAGKVAVIHKHANLDTLETYFFSAITQFRETIKAATGRNGFVAQRHEFSSQGDLDSFKSNF
jgi:hypothetical protein